jgi:hypothetical protein
VLECLRHGSGNGTEFRRAIAWLYFGESESDSQNGNARQFIFLSATCSAEVATPNLLCDNWNNSVTPRNEWGSLFTIFRIGLASTAKSQGRKDHETALETCEQTGDDSPGGGP